MTLQPARASLRTSLDALGDLITYRQANLAHRGLGESLARLSFGVSFAENMMNLKVSLATVGADVDLLAEVYRLRQALYRLSRWSAGLLEAVKRLEADQAVAEVRNDMTEAERYELVGFDPVATAEQMRRFLHGGAGGS